MPATQTQPLTENPLAAGTPKTLLPQPCVLVIFGAAGDLSWRKLMPALYNLNVDGVLPSNFAVVGFGIGAEGDPDEWIRQRAKDGTTRFSRRPPEDSHWADFARSLFYVNGSFNDARAYGQLKARLESIDQQFGVPGARIYYMAVPPQAVPGCVEHLKSSGLVNDPHEQQAFTRVIGDNP